MRRLSLPSGNAMPVFGLGTWRMGEHADQFDHEVEVLRAGLDMGISMIDTAEMYGEGGAEEVVGQALADAIAAGDVRREDVFVVSKVYPHNASIRGMAAASG